MFADLGKPAMRETRTKRVAMAAAARAAGFATAILAAAAIATG